MTSSLSGLDWPAARSFRGLGWQATYLGPRRLKVRPVSVDKVLQRQAGCHRAARYQLVIDGLRYSNSLGTARLENENDKLSSSEVT